MGQTIQTIGHSTRTADEFAGLLAEFSIELLVDVRSHPGSRRLPHFGHQELRKHLAGHGIACEWMPGLGGRRRGQPGSTANLGLRNASFRAYADYMQTPPFAEALADLIERAARRRTAIMCAEAVYWRCHRRLISDALTAAGHAVLHILSPGKAAAHVLTDGAVVSDGRVTYPGPPSLLD
jgi:uncharacterized protein (DUF488 family)